MKKRERSFKRRGAMDKAASIAFWKGGEPKF